MVPPAEEEGDVKGWGKQISIDQRRREFLNWNKSNNEAKSLLSRSVDSAYHWQINGTDLASYAWSITCRAHQFSQSSVISSMHAELSRFFLVDFGDMHHISGNSVVL